ncbi:hypothetical protein [uncultured Helicobacter sp.]|uniref:hypothetical protein n=1 Tax=uncultured Helicobacter sp. TaxID=175537 RepID=UPI00374FAFF9
MTQFEKDIYRYTRNALNRTITRCAREQRELIRAEYALPPKKIRSLTKVYRAKQDKLVASIKNLKVKLSINNFRRVQTKQGVRVHIAKGKSLFFKGAFLGVRKGESKKDNKSGFMATRYANAQTHGFELSESSINSYKNYTNKPRSDRVYYFKTKEFSLIALEKTKTLQKKAITIFEEELAKE